MMRICENCKQLLSETAKYCPFCGYPAKGEKRHVSGKVWVGIVVVCLAVISLGVWGFIQKNYTSPRDISKEYEIANAGSNTLKEDKPIYKPILTEAPVITEEPTITPSTLVPTESPINPATPTPTETPINAIQIYYINLDEEIMKYNGKLVEVIVPIDNVYRGGDLIRAEEGLEYCLNILPVRTLTEQEQKHKYVKARGIVDASESGNYWDRHNVKDCILLEFYDEAPDMYLSQVDEYNDLRKQKRITARDEFIAVADGNVSYEKLRKYPDTYKDKELKIKVKVTKIEVGSLLTMGSIYAELDGKEIVIHDEREVKEPRLVEGDRIVIYVRGDGLAKIQTIYKDSSFWGIVLGTDVVDAYEIPRVKLYFTEQDNIDSF